MVDVYSQRNAPARDVLRYDLPNTVRRRVFITLQQICNDTSNCDFDLLLDELGRKLIAQYGGLARPQYAAAQQHSNPVIEHFLCCHHDLALDYLEVFVQCRQYRGVGQVGVDAVNAVLREEGVGYELSKWVAKVEPPKKPLTGAGLYAMIAGAGTVEIEYPRIIRKDSQLTHESIVKPCLDVLANPAFSQANKEMLDAFAKHRRADFDGALTSCGAAFESVFKTICTSKGWTYDADNALAKMVDVCNANGLFPPFYAEVFKWVGTVRNKLSDAHGRGPKPLYDVGQDHLEHLIHFVSAHIVFLVKLAGV